MKKLAIRICIVHMLQEVITSKNVKTHIHKKTGLSINKQDSNNNRK